MWRLPHKLGVTEASKYLLLSKKDSIKNEKSSNLKRMTVQVFEMHLYAHEKKQGLNWKETKSERSPFPHVTACLAFILMAYPSLRNSICTDQPFLAQCDRLTRSARPVRRPRFPSTFARHESGVLPLSGARKVQVSKKDSIYTILFYCTVYNIQQVIT